MVKRKRVGIFYLSMANAQCEFKLKPLIGRINGPSMVTLLAALIILLWFYLIDKIRAVDFLFLLILNWICFFRCLTN